MGFYYTKDGKCASSIPYSTHVTFLTSTRLMQESAAITIQRWWKKMYHDKLQQQVYRW